MRQFAVVSGGSRGIGKAIASALAARGFGVCLLAKNEEVLRQTCTELQEAYPQAELIYYALNLSDKAACAKMFTDLSLQWPQLDVLVNNAGSFQPGNLMDEADGLFEEMLESNLYSAYYLTRAMFPLLQKGTLKMIVNICSAASLNAYPRGGSYGIAKFGMLGFSRNLRLELAAQGYRVSAIMPGPVLTDSWGEIDLPKERFIMPEDIAEVVIAGLEMSPQAFPEEILMNPIAGKI